MYSKTNLLFLGDLCLTGDVEQNLIQNQSYDLWHNVHSLVNSDDTVVANVECSISSRGELSPEKYASLRAAPAVVQKLGRLDVALLANNHVGDYGEQAANDTKKKLEANNILTTGYGCTLAEALKPLIFRRNSIDIGILSLCCLSTHPREFAKGTSSGVAPLALRLLKEQLSALQDKADVIFVCLHWGKEGQRYPTLDQMRFARRAIDLGAHMVIGCHAHVIQAFEQYRGRWIFYGLGNFLFPPIPITVTQPDGLQEHRILNRPPSERESIGILVAIERTLDGANIELKQVIPLRFNEDLVPQRCKPRDMTCDLPNLNKNLRISSILNFSALRGNGELRYRTEYTNRLFNHFYASKDAYPIFPFSFKELPYLSMTFGRRFLGKLHRQLGL